MLISSIRPWRPRIFQCSLIAIVASALSVGQANAQVVVAGVDPELSALLARCAPTVHPETMAAVVSAESRGHQFAIADAGPVKLPWAQRKALVRSLYPGSLQEAVSTAQTLIANGHTVSLGVAQVNDRNLARMGVSIQDVFDPCVNIAVGGKILTDFYEKAVAKFGNGPAAMNAALSAYNSGDWQRGARDGYVNLIYKQVGKPLALRTERIVPRITRTAAVGADARPEQTNQRAFTMKATSFSVAEMH
ncbi:lytic transglycosylase domain-containing protein [Cupriavidus necator]|uniref:lytic transglycosylase domain-containing protein n=1 Tax=Cupriavidus necator TaxID=106590 RepID=UPI003ECE099A